MKLQHLKTLRTIVKYRKMKEDIKSIEIATINSKIAENNQQQQHINHLLQQNRIINTTDSGTIVTAIHYYEKQSSILQDAKQTSKSLADESQKLLTEFQDLYVERKVAENILEERKNTQKRLVFRRSIRLNDELSTLPKR